MACRAPREHVPRRRLPAPSRDMPARIPRRHPVRGTGRRAAADQEMPARDLTFGAPGTSAGCGAAQTGSGACAAGLLIGEESHACSCLLPRAPGPNLDRSHVRPGQRQRTRAPRHPRPERHPRPDSDPPCRPPSKGHGRTPVPRSHGRKRQRLKGLGKPPVRAQAVTRAGCHGVNWPRSVTGASLLSRHGKRQQAWHDGVEARFRDLRNRTYRLQMLKDLGCVPHRGRSTH